MFLVYYSWQNIHNFYKNTQKTKQKSQRIFICAFIILNSKSIRFFYLFYFEIFIFLRRNHSKLEIINIPKTLSFN